MSRAPTVIDPEDGTPMTAADSPELTVVAAAAAEKALSASTLQLIGAFLFGVVLGWFTYFVNRHRTGDVALADIGTLVAAVGAGAVLTLFPAGTDMFGAYGVGLAVGFFAYFALLVAFVRAHRSDGWTFAWFLDGRRPKLKGTEMEGSGQRPMGNIDQGGTGIRR